MTRPGRENEDKIKQALKQAWDDLETAYPIAPAQPEVWSALVRERRKNARRKLWRDLIVLWSVALPVITGMLLLGRDFSELSVIFWKFQALSSGIGILVLLSEIRKKRNKEPTAYE
ncbi:YxlC family protein [Cohnella sp.]|uniref:YxlC family protein n=1 Tax=Cohnella sp. TaxID=1883426 RepID=UPI00356471C5